VAVIREKSSGSYKRIEAVIREQRSGYYRREAVIREKSSGYKREEQWQL